jgi:hypothetical protein
LLTSTIWSLKKEPRILMSSSTALLCCVQDGAVAILYGCHSEYEGNSRRLLSLHNFSSKTQHDRTRL